MPLVAAAAMHPLSNPKVFGFMVEDSIQYKSSALIGKMRGKLDVNDKRVFFAAVILILLLNVYLRLGLFRYQGFFEPDGFFYSAVVRQAIENHFVVSSYLNLSGFGAPHFIGEAPGLAYLTVVPYFFLRFFGVNYITIMRLLPVVFGVLSALMVYWITKELGKSRTLGLIAMLLLSVSSGNIARTGALIYRGDSFIGTVLLGAIVLMIAALKTNSNRRCVGLSALSAMVLGSGVAVWNGSPFIIVVYLLSVVLLASYAFILADKDLLGKLWIISVSLIITFVVERVYAFAGIARSGLVLEGYSFFVFYVPILILTLLARFLIGNSSRYPKLRLGEIRVRIAYLIIAIVAVTIVLMLFFSSYVYGELSAAGVTSRANGGAININNAIGQTTQELQKPTLGFLFASFNIQLYLAPLGAILFLIFWRFSDKISLWQSEAQKRTAINAFMPVAAYGIVTGFLQYMAIRYNALISVPLTIMAAFGIYGCMKLIKRLDSNEKPLVMGLVSLITIAVLFELISHTNLSVLFNNFALTLVVITILAGSTLSIGYCAYSFMRKKLFARNIAIALFIALLSFNVYGTYITTHTATQADGVNSSFLTAMQWLSKNTPSNATVLALWPDGSVVEGWGNRTSLMDSVGGERRGNIINFSRYLFSNNPNVSYLYSIGRPEYIVARGFWFNEIGGIATEGLVSNSSDYGYVTLDGVNINNANNTSRYTFTSSTPPYYKAVLLIATGTNGTSKFAASLGEQGGTLTPIRRVLFYNDVNYSYSVVNSSVNDTLNYTLMVSYAGNSISGAAILGSRLPTSNLFKFAVLCNMQTCPYGSNAVKITPVFINGDTRILKVNYSQ